MPSDAPRIGVPTVQISVDDDATDVPSLATLVFQACAISYTDILPNDPNPRLSTSDTYQIMLGLVGRDIENGGYTVGRCSPSSGDLVLSSASQVIQISVNNEDWPADYDAAICAAIFLKINSAKFQLAGFAYIDPAADFSKCIIRKPLSVAPRFDTSILQSTTEDDILGSRDPKGITWGTAFPTSGPVTVRRAVSNVTVSPNTSSDYNIATTRTSSVSFQSLNNDMKAWVEASSGLYVKYADGADTIYEASMSLNTTQALVTGNKPILLTMPTDPKTGVAEVRLMIGNLTSNQTEVTESWSKTDTTLVNFQFDPAALDTLITNQHTEIVYARRTG